MNDDILKGNWTQLKGKAREMWGDLSGDELDQIEGNRAQLEGKLQEKYGKTKEDAKKAVDDLINSL